MKLSAVLITYNESRNIERALRSVAWCDEIIVVDSGSSDDTVEKAKALGAQVFTRTFDGFGAQKGYAVSCAKNDMVLSLDADEEISEELRKSIESIPTSDHFDGYYLQRIDRFHGKILKHALGGQGSLIRLFDRRKGNFNLKTIHESVEISGATGKLRGMIYHDSYHSISVYFDKFNKHTSMMAELKFEQGKRTSVAGVLLRFPLSLFDSIVAKHCFLDGYEGVLMGIFHSLYTTVKYAKLLELQHSKV